MTWTGTPEECRRKFGCIPVGSFLFILEQNGKEPEKYKKDGIGNASHIGIYTGKTGATMVRLAKEAGVVNAGAYNFGDGAIHSSASRGHVCTSTFKGNTIKGGWNRIGLWDRLSYGDAVDAILKGKTEDRSDGQVSIATVVAESGTTVNMRRRADTAGALVMRVPIGEKVTVNDRGNEWCEIMYLGEHGYMMTKFLDFGDAAEEPQKITVAKADMEEVYNILGGCVKQFIVNKGDIEKAYDMIGDWLGLRG